MPMTYLGNVSKFVTIAIGNVGNVIKMIQIAPTCEGSKPGTKD
jgi:hypothetical protein